VVYDGYGRQPSSAFHQPKRKVVVVADEAVIKIVALQALGKHAIAAVIALRRLLA
jgi:hypothetical protein